MQDDYEGDFSSRRVLLYTLRFTAKTYLFGPVSSASKDIIKNPLSTIVLESIQQIRKEKYLTLPYQEQLKIMLVMLQPHLQMILIKQQKLLKL